MPAYDEFAIAVRAYAVPVPKPADATKWAGEKRRRRTVPPVPPSPWTLTFDTEFRVDAAQQLTVGTYQVREAGELRETGFFFDPVTLSDAERSTLYTHALEHGLAVREIGDFVEAVVFPVLLDLDGTCIGFNLPLDLSRLALHHDVAHSASMRGGFTFQLSIDPYRPWLQVRHLNSHEAFIRFAAPARQRTPRGMRKRKLAVPVSRGHFVDVHTLAGALLEHKGELRTLAELLAVPTKKGSVETYEGPITAAFLDYAMADAEVTWECHAELARRYAAVGLPTPIDHIYSAASIGKAHLDAMGIRPWRDVQSDMPPELTGAILASYYGGRSEVHLRRVVTQVRHCDFLSMYPTVCTLMGLWRFVTATGMTWSDTTVETQAFLDAVTLDTLQHPATWRELTTIVELIPDYDLLPVRGKYDGTSYAIGLNYLATDGAPIWYPLADLITAKLNGGHIPRIRRTITFTPKRRQARLQPIELMGNPAYHVDPARDDAFRRIIELRSAIKAEKTAATRAGDTARADRHDAEQLALKIIANATSYGIFIELNVSEAASPVDVTCYGRAGRFISSDRIDTIETPGRYFHPLLATLITAAARQPRPREADDHGRG